MKYLHMFPLTLWKIFIGAKVLNGKLITFSVTCLQNNGFTLFFTPFRVFLTFLKRCVKEYQAFSFQRKVFLQKEYKDVGKSQ